MLIPTAYIFPRDFASTARPTGRPFSQGLRARTARLPDRYIFPRELDFTARPTGCHFSEKFFSPAPPGSPTAYIFPRDFDFIAWLTDRPFFRGILSPAPRPLTLFRGILLSPLGSPVAPFPRDLRARHRQAPRPLTFFRGILLFIAWLTGRPFSEGLRARHRQAPRPLTVLRGNSISQLGPPVTTSPRDFRAGTARPATAYIFPRDFVFIAWLTGRPFAEGFRARHRQAPRPLTCFRGILLAPLGSPLTSSPRDSAP